MGKSKKALVTGGAGFIGSHIVDALIAKGYRVVVLDNLSTGKRKNVNARAQFVRGDMCDLKTVRRCMHGVDVVFHCAAKARIQPSIKDPISTMHNNVDGMLNVLVAARDAKVRRLVYSASSSAYGDQDRLPLREGMLVRLKNPYSLSKYMGEELCRVFSTLYGLETVSLRYFNVYGPRQITEGAYAAVIGIFIKQYMRGKPLTIVGTGDNRRDYTFVADIVRGNLLAAQSKRVGRGETINLGTGKNCSSNQLAAMVLTYLDAQKNRTFKKTVVRDVQRTMENFRPALKRALRQRRAVHIPPWPGESKVTLADASKARKLLNWKPRVSLAEGLTHC